jgi:hypothetical protein
MNKTEKTRIRNEIAKEMKDSFEWLKSARRNENRSLIARCSGEIEAFRIAGKIIGK